jgi:hypothetical protein
MEGMPPTASMCQSEGVEDHLKVSIGRESDGEQRNEQGTSEWRNVLYG